MGRFGRSADIVTWPLPGVDRIDLDQRPRSSPTAITSNYF